jgi:hypothetical protein
VPAFLFVYKASPKGADAGDAAAKTPTSSSDEMPEGIKFADKEKKAWDVQLAKLAKAEKAQADKEAKEKAKEDKARAEKEKKDAAAAEKEAKALAAKDAKGAAVQAKLDAKAAKVFARARLAHLSMLARKRSHIDSVPLQITPAQSPLTLCRCSRLLRAPSASTEPFQGQKGQQRACARRAAEPVSPVRAINRRW